MAIVSMRKLSICANKKKRKAILETLQKLGAMQIITDPLADEDFGLRTMDTQSARMQFEKTADSFDRVLKLLAVYAPEKQAGIAALSGKKEIPRSEIERVVRNRGKYLKDASEILKMDKEISERRTTIIKDGNQIAALKPWMQLDVPLSTTGTKNTAVLIGTLTEPLTAEELLAAASKDVPEPVCVDAEIISSSNEMTCVSVITHRKDLEKVEENLRAIGFSRPTVQTRDVPSKAAARYEADIAKQNRIIGELGGKIAGYAEHRADYAIAADYFRTRAEKYRLLGTIPQSEYVFFLEGWVPADHAGEIAELLRTRYDAVVEEEEIREDEMEPTLLRNNAFSRSVEGVLESYGLPTRGHVDPTFVMSFFYVFFFGMMLSDAGYGILMFVVCAIVLAKFKKIEPGLRKMLQLFFWCGLSTAFWGFMYGGFFGDVIDVVAQTFFGYTGGPILRPLWFAPLKDPMRLLMWCMLFGLIHLFAGLALKGYEYLRRGDVVGFISDVLAWYFLIIGLVLMLLPSDLFKSISGMDMRFPAWTGMLAKVLAVAGLLIILVMSGRANRNWGIRIALGAYDIYGVTSWLSDVLSYSRLLALGLATGVIASVINMMAAMVGKSPLGVVGFALVFILGHTLNIGINALGAYVHTNRLQFVEFFGKFYEGGGKAFAPFRTANKYIEIKEDKSL